MAEKKKPGGKKKKAVSRKSPGTNKSPRRQSAESTDSGHRGKKQSRDPKRVVQNPYAIPASPNRAATPYPEEKKDLIKALIDHADGVTAPESDSSEIDPAALSRGDDPMTVVDHLDELRSRLVITLIVVLVLTMAAFVFSDELLKIITRPFNESGFKLNVFKLTEGFMIKLKVSAILSLLVSFPFILFQGWRFIVPAIAKEDRMFSRLTVIASVFLFYAGVAFVFFFLMPFTVKVLLSFVVKDMISTIGANDYISIVLLFCVVMGLLFELPIAIIILTRIGLITPAFLVRKRKYAFVMAFVISAVITPTQDALTMLIVAVPLAFLYEISIIISKFVVVRKKKRDLGG